MGETTCDPYETFINETTSSQRLLSCFVLNAAPRTAIGQKSDDTVLLLVINGRSKESIGTSLKETQDVLLAEGAVNAALLDGGSPYTMYFNGSVINTPSYSSGERIIPSAFLVLP